MTSSPVQSPPPWWPEAKHEIDERLEKFGESLSKKLRDFTKSPMGVIARKNPFLFRIRAKDNPAAYIDSVLDAYCSASEETMFGNLMEDCAKIICRHAKQGDKAHAAGIDLDYLDGNVRYLVQVKSGPNWGNSAQKAKLRDQFTNARKVYGANESDRHMVCIEGHTYGKSNRKDEGTHLVLTGPDFWMEISGWEGCSDALLQLIGEHANNGLESVRKDAKAAGIQALEQAGIIDNNAIDWLRLHHHVADKRKG